MQFHDFRDITHSEDYSKFKEILEPRVHHLGLHPLHDTLDYRKLAEEQLLQCKFMENISDLERQELFSKIKIKHYFSGQTIYQRNEECNELIFILRGTVQLGWHTELGRYIIHKFIPSGILLNIIYLISNSLFEHEFIAHEATVVAVIPKEVFLPILNNNSKMLYDIFRLVCQRNRLLDNDIYNQSTQSLRVQIARQLLYLYEYFSSQQNGIIKLSIKLSQENLADLLKTSRQSIRKEMQKFIDEGIIESKYNQINILDIDGLRNIL
ncbi:transcriptional regulator (plasmid) [Acinetobacter sp. NCu2D-2]|uniref:Crp/Fnr family transcriptional regulator n=1 Tax=Acinetobacter sp. NCu2D-2 TaxID=1608473 RepID=UPI0007CDE022|nr:Crp/Fnr family transcriptional regulator [Acinetobacter sp. NCu2D-2]ANF83214.1 transcriptional regulator [Acinetobacter sp. NCu2D-2]